MKQEQRIETRSVKHLFTVDERNQLGQDLARSIAGLRGIDTEFDQIKASFKAKITEKEAQIDKLSTDNMNGFEMRNERCVVVFDAKTRKKSYFIEADYKANPDIDPVLVEDMTHDDFQADLIQSEARFDAKEEIELFPPADSSRGILVVGRFNNKWFGALRVRIGGNSINERLDSEQPCCKQRCDQVRKSAKRLTEWLVETLGKETAKGFEGPIAAAIEPHKEREE